MNTTITNSTTALHTSEDKRINRIRILLNAACAARGGARQMTLDDWRNVEQEIMRKLEDEWSKPPNIF